MSRAAVMTPAYRDRILQAGEGDARTDLIKRWCARKHFVSAEAARGVLSLCGSFDIARALRSVSHCMLAGDWWQLFGEQWSHADDGWRVTSFLRDKLTYSCAADRALAMDGAEVTALSTLPRAFYVWRGCYEHNRKGVSWSLSREIAERFTLQHRYSQPGLRPLLLRGVANRSLSLLKLDRSEQEVMTGYVERVEVVR